MSNNPRRVAVVLCGCGRGDGSEIHESSAVIINLSRAGAEISMFAPNMEQYHVIDHHAGTVDEGKARNMMIEAARIARGEIFPLNDLEPENFDAIIFPGGAGVGKNLCNFATNKEDFMVLPEIFGELGCELTIGNDTPQSGRWPLASTTKILENLGVVHVNKDVTEAHVDQNNKIVTTPAFMCGTAKYHEVFDGISELVKNVMELA
ncbi:ES1 protein-like protein, mitochondrial [Trichoplax sp. H2]|nr:ES1 protein-like protein, mitochondrial [Trichoplax sp. H2]|eukprot:RDD41976.1 ES1 protein-like protein, mitochondrial [Trichoplax sp. H2]